MEHKDLWIVIGLTIILAVTVSLSTVSLTGDAIWDRKIVPVATNNQLPTVAQDYLVASDAVIRDIYARLGALESGSSTSSGTATAPTSTGSARPVSTQPSSSGSAASAPTSTGSVTELLLAPHAGPVNSLTRPTVSINQWSVYLRSNKILTRCTARTSSGITYQGTVDASSATPPLPHKYAQKFHFASGVPRNGISGTIVFTCNAGDGSSASTTLNV